MNEEELEKIWNGRIEKDLIGLTEREKSIFERGNLHGYCQAISDIMGVLSHMQTIFLEKING